MLPNYTYVPTSSNLLQVNSSNITQTFNTLTCAANGIEYTFPATTEFVYKTCTVNSVNMLFQLNATNISRQIANFSNGTSNYVLGNGFLYFGLGDKVFQLNASNVSQQISNFTTYTSISNLVYPTANRNYLFIAAGSVMYQLDANNITNRVANYTASATISSPAVLAKGFLYFAAGSNLYQLGSYSPFTSSDLTPPSITFNGPSANYTNDTMSPINITFNCSASDETALQNISLYLTNNQSTNFTINQTIITSNTSTSAVWTIGLLNGNYTWNCLAIDASNNSAFAGSNRTILLNFTDADGDGITDSADSLRGNTSSVNTSGINSLNVTVNNSAANGTFTGEKIVMFYDSSVPFLNFTFNFTAGILYLDRITVFKNATGIIINLSGQLQSSYNKTIYFNDSGFYSLCVKDSDVASINDISVTCTEANETNLTSCLGSSSTLSFGNITCNENNNLISIGGLRYSGVRGSVAPNAESAENTEEMQDQGGSARYIQEIKTTDKLVRLKIAIPAGISFSKEINDDKGTGLKQFELKAKDFLTGTVSIQQFDEKPSRCDIEYGNEFKMYKAIEFKHDFSNEEIESARVRLGIYKEWITDNKISEIKVVRCYPQYELLPASYINENDNEAVYDVYSKGFSIYAVLGTLKSYEVEQLAPSSSWKFPIKTTLLVLAILLIAYCIWFLHRRRASFTEDFHLQNRWFDFEWKFKLKFNTPPHDRKFFGPR